MKIKLEYILHRLSGVFHNHTKVDMMLLFYNIHNKIYVHKIYNDVLFFGFFLIFFLIF